MKLFCVSDLHSFFTPLKHALDAKGFEPNNPEHLLVCCGDVFDRGRESVEIFKYLNSLTNVVLIRGNHEDMLEELLDRGYSKNYDISNGTTNTVVDLVDHTGEKTKSTIECCNAVKKLITPFFNKYVNYFETKNYIFVHSWIPLIINDDLPMYYTENRNFEFKTDWRESTDSEWESAMWGCPYKLLLQGLYPANKTIVCGHWHARDFHTYVENKFEVDDSIFISDNCIALDACTVLSGECNVYSFDE